MHFAPRSVRVSTTYGYRSNIPEPTSQKEQTRVYPTWSLPRLLFPILCYPVGFPSNQDATPDRMGRSRRCSTQRTSFTPVNARLDTATRTNHGLPMRVKAMAGCSMSPLFSLRRLAAPRGKTLRSTVRSSGAFEPTRAWQSLLLQHVPACMLGWPSRKGFTWQSNLFEPNAPCLEYK